MDGRFVEGRFVEGCFVLAPVEHLLAEVTTIEEPSCARLILSIQQVTGSQKQNITPLFPFGRC